MPTAIDQAIVLRHWEYSETSQTVSLLGREQGLVRGLAKGSRRERGAFSGGFEALTRGEIVAIVKPTTELATLTAWNLEEIYWGPRRDLRAHRAGLYMVDVVRHGIIDHDPHPGLFDALAQSLRDLDESGGVERTLMSFQWNLLREMGLQPRLDSPDSLREHRAWLFDPRSGALAGPAGTTGPEGAWRVRSETLSLLGSIEHSTAAGASGGSVTIQRASRLLAEYLRVALDVDLPSRRSLFGPAVERSDARRRRNRTSRE